MECTNRSCSNTFEITGNRKKFCSSICKNRSAVKTARTRLKNRAIEYKGGGCVNCGYSKFSGALQFHHLDPSKKDFNLAAKGLTRAWSKVSKELDKCILVCANCHAEIHGGE